MYKLIYTMLHSRFTCPKVRAIKQDKVIQLIRQHRIALEQQMHEIRQREKQMMVDLLHIVFDEEAKHNVDYEEEKASRIHG